MSIEKYFILNKYLLSLFGASDNKELFDELKNKSEGVDVDGRSYFVNTLKGIKNLKIGVEELLKYDENIQSYVRKISHRRGPISLKYFQYLAVLFTEIVLDNLKNRKMEFLGDLNNFLEQYKGRHNIGFIDHFEEKDLKKLAFWMATGSGKTLIMHINYHQFFNYKLFSPDNILLITPNEGLSKQHFEELNKSGIPCRLYNGSLNGGFRSENEVLIIEITKLVEEKKGRGITLPVEVFGDKNLLFVDEGHKGKKSEEQKWARLRNKLAENGFVFEYSATFGQILSEKQPEILEEYAKSIIFDYSYKYFYLDGYGKDFSILNVEPKKDISDEEFSKLMFVANLLSFYEQILVYEENTELAKEYNIEKPLWIFVGTTVSGKEEESDVIQIVKFIKEGIENKDGWVNELIKDILDGQTGLKDEKGNDIFKDRFEYLKKKGFDLEDLYKRVFNGRGSLEIYELKNAKGELGLKTKDSLYFGVINIGDVSGFKKELEKIGIEVKQDSLHGSLFDEIKKENSKINILIGSKKFIEGWDTWRVSSMGLLNIGKGQGPQIIQLFGRGVRLKGKGMSLKRIGDPLPIKLLERLNVYGIKANYLKKFLEAIKKEEVEFEVIEIPIKTQHEDKWKELYILEPRQDKKFEEEEIIELEPDDKIHYRVDLLPKVLVHSGESMEIKPEGREWRFTDIDMIHWQRIYQEILEFKMQRNYSNLVFDYEVLKTILLYGKYTVLLPSEDIKDLEKLEDIALLVIKKYIDLFYRRRAKKFETENLHYSSVKGLPLHTISQERQGYVVRINKEKKDIVNEIRNLAENLEKLLKEDERTLPRIYFDGSLYVPILLQSREIDKISPAGLVESEKKFIKGLKRYLKDNKNTFEVYLLRNYPFSGVGFQLKWAGFYPDFIMWIKKGQEQTIVFIDPKGLEHSKGLKDEKIVFAGGQEKDDEEIITIKDIQKKLGNKVRLESFILSETPYEKLIEGMASPPKKEEYEKKHVLFLEDPNWPQKLFEGILDFLHNKA